MHVAGVKIDTTKDIKDIKVPPKIPYTFRKYCHTFSGNTYPVVLIVLVVWFLKTEEKTTSDENFTPSATRLGIKELDKLQKKNYGKQEK